jgi:5-(carboxyamino)imidazole ribonucleotide synthase
VDVITVEFENIPEKAARVLAELVPFYPSPVLFRICRHRGREKQCLRELGIATAPFALVASYEALGEAVTQIGTPCILKQTTLGYDGKGQYRLHDISDMAAAWGALGGAEIIVEGMVPFLCEASVIVARDATGEVQSFPVARNTHEGGILVRSDVPASLPGEAEATMHALAREVAQATGLTGILAIECFIMQDGQVLVNEMAPRPHNSGHWTMDACCVSQFEQLLRICAGLPLVSPDCSRPVVMHNLIGEEALRLGAWWREPSARIHLYGKAECRAGRKMGHVNCLGGG